MAEHVLAILLIQHIESVYVYVCVYMYMYTMACIFFPHVPAVCTLMNFVGQGNMSVCIYIYNIYIYIYVCVCYTDLHKGV